MADGELCRVTVVAPRVRLDVAVPHEVPLASLLPTLLWHSGEAEEGHKGWVLQRVGEGPLDSGLTMAALGIHDGDVLYLRTQRNAMPAPVFDDSADAITTTLREQARRWSPADTRIAARSAIVLLLAAGALALAVAAASGSAKLVIALAAACVAGSTLLGAAAASRAAGDATLAAAIALGGLPYAFVAGLLVLPGTRAAPAFLVGCTAFVIAAALGVAAVGHAASMLTGAVAAGFAGVIGGLLAVVTSAAGGAAAVVSLALVATPAIAPIAYRLARLPRPNVPASGEELRQRPEPVAADVPERGITADRLVGALVFATGVVAVIAVAIMLRRPGWGEPALAALAGGLLILRARLFTGIVPRGSLLGAGLLSIVLLISLEASRWPVVAVIGAVIGATAASSAVAVAATVARRPSPPLARAVTLVELIAVIATVPLALQVLGVFHGVRALGG